MIQTSDGDGYILPAVGRPRLAEVDKTAYTISFCKNIRQTVITVRQNDILRRTVVFQPIKKLIGIFKTAFSEVQLLLGGWKACSRCTDNRTHPFPTAFSVPVPQD